MKFSELPVETQKILNEEREEIRGKTINTDHLIHLYNKDDKRYTYARRHCRSWDDDKGHSMPFGGGSYWTLSYGKVQFERYRNPLGQRDYRLCDGVTFRKSANGTVIPSTVATKKEVINIINQIGIFNL